MSQKNSKGVIDLYVAFNVVKSMFMHQPPINIPSPYKILTTDAVPSRTSESTCLKFAQYKHLVAGPKLVKIPLLQMVRPTHVLMLLVCRMVEMVGPQQVYIAMVPGYRVIVMECILVEKNIGTERAHSFEIGADRDDISGGENIDAVGPIFQIRRILICLISYYIRLYNNEVYLYVG